MPGQVSFLKTFRIGPPVIPALWYFLKINLDVVALDGFRDFCDLSGKT